jgi:hypothetical protein
VTDVTGGGFGHGLVDPREAGRKGGRTPRGAKRGAPYPGTVFDLMDAAAMTGPTWEPWRSVLRTSLALPYSGQDLLFYRAHTGRQTPPAAPVSECWVVAGRRGGKSRIAATVGLTKAIQFDARNLAPGELAVVPIIAADQKQARAVLFYARALCQLPEVKPYVNRVLRDTIEFRSGVNLEVHTASYRTIRGMTVVGAVLDEVAFWRDDSSANPDSEILDALKPGMATVPDALLFAISSPYARRGELFSTYQRYYGQEDSADVIVWVADTRSLNPSVPEKVIDRAFAEDAIAAASEYGMGGTVSFRHDVEAFLPPESIEAVTVQGRRELPPLGDLSYSAFVDPSGGSQDSFTLGIAHMDDEGRGILDCVRETRPPFSPDAVVTEYAALLRTYGITEVIGDRYAGEWPREVFRNHGIRYETSEYTKSDLYREIVAPVNAGRVELLSLPTLTAQLVGLERRVARGGKDSIDHAPGGRDDVANAAVGALTLVVSELDQPKPYNVIMR